MLKSLNETFGLERQLSFQTGRGGLIKAVLANDYGDAEIYLHGAHLSHYQPSNLAPVIWMSDSALFSTDNAIRGGVPVCWPWFGAHASNTGFPQHGLARLSEWSVISSAEGTDGQTCISLGLRNEGEFGLWPYPFEIVMTFTLGKRLSLALNMQNNADITLEFGAALHSYFAVGDSRAIHIEGLDNCEYLDKADNFALKKQRGDIRISAEVDRVYVNTRTDCIIHDPVMERSISISKEGSRSTIVWNPGQAGSEKMSDFDDAGYLEMVCVETANAAMDSRHLKPREKHQLVQHITVL